MISSTIRSGTLYGPQSSRENTLPVSLVLIVRPFRNCTTFPALLPCVTQWAGADMDEVILPSHWPRRSGSKRLSYEASEAPGRPYAPAGAMGVCSPMGNRHGGLGPQLGRASHPHSMTACSATIACEGEVMRNHPGVCQKRDGRKWSYLDPKLTKAVLTPRRTFPTNFASAIGQRQGHGHGISFATMHIATII